MELRFNSIRRLTWSALAARLEPSVALATVAYFLLSYLIHFLAEDAFVQRENYRRIPILLARPADLSRLLDVCLFDSCLERFRPGGHLLELIDAHLLLDVNPWLGWGFRSGLGFFLVLASVLALAWAVRGIYPAVTRVYALALGSFLLVAPQILVASRMYFRPGKHFSLAFAALVLGWWVRDRRRPTRIAWGIGALGLTAAALTDEQCVLVIAIFLALCGLEWPLGRPRRGFPRAGLVALATYALAVKIVGPWTYSRFASGTVKSGFSDPGIYLAFRPDILRGSFEALWLQARLLFGNSDGGGFPLWSGVPLLAGAAWLAFRPRSPLTDPARSAVWIPGALLLLLWLALYLLTIRHPPLLWPDVEREGYYYLAPTLLLYGALLLTLARREALASPSARVLFLGFLLWTGAGNLSSVDQTQAQVFAGHQWPDIKDSRAIRAALAADAPTLAQVPLPSSESAAVFHAFYRERIRLHR